MGQDGGHCSYAACYPPHDDCERGGNPGGFPAWNLLWFTPLGFTGCMNSVFIWDRIRQRIPWKSQKIFGIHNFWF